MRYIGYKANSFSSVFLVLSIFHLLLIVLSIMNEVDMNVMLKSKYELRVVIYITDLEVIEM